MSLLPPIGRAPGNQGSIISRPSPLDVAASNKEERYREEAALVSLIEESILETILGSIERTQGRDGE